MVTIRLHNSKTRKKEAFSPLDPANVRMYVCGPTVYDRAHLGNGRPVVVFDTLYRLLRHVYGAEHVTYVRNFTDVDDKINATALARKEAGDPRSMEALIHERTEETIGWYHADMDALGALRPDHEPRATAYIGPMVAMIEGLIAGGHAYARAGHVLFRVRSYKAYGALSGRSVDDMIAGARVEVAPFKEDPMDFVLWKPSSEEEPGWSSPWGRGRPGWHIECSAMSYELLGASFDIHGGGLDLQFPHHENEIAQSCCAHPEAGFAQVWLHNEMLQVEGKKMSKSLGNFFTVRDLLDQGVPGEVIRMVYLSTHYRKPMDWTAEKAREAEGTLRKIAQFLSRDPFTKPWVDVSKAVPPQEVVDALANDLNTSLALTHVSKYLKDEQEMQLVGALDLLGFDVEALKAKFAGFELHAWDNGFASGHSLRASGIAPAPWQDQLRALRDTLSKLRQDAMQTKNFAPVDALKSALTAAGVEVRMSKAGVELLPGPGFDPAKLEGLK
ncbi:cysteine--tRNA ligase [Tabrizicola oligotrophica]|uniref:Cysteine--tRNA ligase n=1 Tax=Tabrizicola oligotrophica TaxID=2710650 RepID=A0A6M0QR43_9RHOB|nr:cysteine--tRNA ligase [Tabrizicola oligotrophica]NEY89123.1 cysteine--tRNA ligase [Tabrizicola oligotrophica]